MAIRAVLETQYRKDLESGDAAEDDDPLMLGPHQPTKVRNAFARKVLTIVGIQMLFTFLSCLAVGLYFFKEDKVKVGNDYGHVGLSMVLSGGFMVFAFLIAACWPSNLRSYPGNYCWLAFLTLGETFMVVPLAAIFPIELLISFGVGVAIFIALVAYASTTSADFTGWGPYITVLVLAFIGGTLAAVLVPHQSESMAPLLGSGIVIMCAGFFVVRSLQLVMREDTKNKLSVDDYVFGAALIYLDLMRLIMEILVLILRYSKR